MLMPANWTDWAALVQIIQFITVLFALLYARNQAKEANRSRELQATLVLFDMIGQEDLRELRKQVMNETEADTLVRDYADRGPQAEAARRLAVRYDRICYLARKNLLPEDALFEFQGDELVRLWEKLSPLIIAIRIAESRPGYCGDFELAAAKAAH